MSFHKLDTSYMKRPDWEGSTIHPHTRISGPEEHRLHSLSRNMDVPYKLFEAGLRLYGESVIDYHDKRERKGDMRYYPSVIMTFWSGFESYIRYSSEVMLITVKDIPQVVANYLLEREVYLNKKGEQCVRDRYQPTLDRYALLLKYGYHFAVDRGNKHWQNLQKAKELRDYYTHLDVSEPKALSSQQVLDYMEHILLGLIWPSCELRRTLLLGVYRLYQIWAEFRELQSEYIEQPFFKDWPLKEEYMFHCNFENVDTSRFPNSREALQGKPRGSAL